MATDTEDTGFLSRWSRRKVQVRQGAAVPDAVLPLEPGTTPAGQQVVAPQAMPDLAPAPVRTGAIHSAAGGAAPADSAAAETPAEPAPTLEDVQRLTRDSDFKRFVTRGVQPDVKNAALAKLFTDPHFNVMDGLDVYIDDYGIPDPLPPGMLRQMLQSKMLGLFDDEPTTDTTTPEATPAEPTPPDALLTDSAELPATTTPADENTDLQLQPDDDAGHAGPAPGVEQNTGRPD